MQYIGSHIQSHVDVVRTGPGDAYARLHLWAWARTQLPLRYTARRVFDGGEVAIRASLAPTQSRISPNLDQLNLSCVRSKALSFGRACTGAGLGEKMFKIEFGDATCRNIR